MIENANIEFVKVFSSYWAVAIYISTGFYFLMSFAGKQLSEDANARLSLWLKGDYQSKWAEEFCNVFDSIFGSKHLSVRCFGFSSALSIASVLVLYVLFAEVFDLFQTRTIETISLLAALLTGAIINLIPDYISLYETRWVLKKLSKVKSVFLQFLILLCDLLFSAIIIIVFIYLYQNFAEGSQTSWIEIVAILTTFSVFFYSTFVTSVWAWIFFLSKSFITFLTKTRLSDFLDVDGKPTQVMGAVGAVLIFAVAAAGTPLFKPDAATKVTRIDNVLCNIFPKQICAHNARRLSEDEALVLKLLNRACEAGNTEQCMEVAKGYYEDDVKKAIDVWVRACTWKEAEACYYLGGAYHSGDYIEKDTEKAIKFYQKSCDENYPAACINLAHEYMEGEIVEKDIDRGFSLLTPWCTATVVVPVACTALTQNLIEFFPEDKSKILLANEYSQRACDVRGSCYSHAQSFLNGIGRKKDVKKGVALLKTSCEDSRHGLSCIAYLNAISDAEREDIESSTLRDYYRRACAYDLYELCYRLAAMHETGFEDEPASFGKAWYFYELACLRKFYEACYDSARLYKVIAGAKFDINKYSASLKKGCDYGHQLACYQIRATMPSDYLEKQWIQVRKSYSERCDQDDPYSCYEFAELLRVGVGGEKDLAVSHRAHKKACKFGDHYGCVQLGYNLLYGIGTQRDSVEALSKFQSGCDADIAIGCYEAARMLSDKKGVEASETEIYTLKEKACNLGLEIACDEIE